MDAPRRAGDVRISRNDQVPIGHDSRQRHETEHGLERDLGVALAIACGPDDHLVVDVHERLAVFANPACIVCETHDEARVWHARKDVMRNRCGRRCGAEQLFDAEVVGICAGIAARPVRASQQGGDGERRVGESVRLPERQLVNGDLDAVIEPGFRGSLGLRGRLLVARDERFRLPAHGQRRGECGDEHQEQHDADERDASLLVAGRTKTLNHGQPRHDTTGHGAGPRTAGWWSDTPPYWDWARATGPSR